MVDYRPMVDNIDPLAGLNLLVSHFTFMLQYRKLKPKWYINLKCFNQARIPGPDFFVQLLAQETS